jgi:AraC family carnitine catabolism transcriptional activator
MLLPEFSMMAFTAAIEPLRAANRMSGERLYSWHTFSLDGAPVIASNGVHILAGAPSSALKPRSFRWPFWPGCG